MILLNALTEVVERPKDPIPLVEREGFSSSTPGWSWSRRHGGAFRLK